MLIVGPLHCNYINVFNRCSDYEHFGYYCVDFFLCNSDANNTINTSGAGLFYSELFLFKKNKTKKTTQ